MGTLEKSRPGRNAALCGILSDSALFAKTKSIFVARNPIKFGNTFVHSFRLYSISYTQRLNVLNVIMTFTLPWPQSCFTHVSMLVCDTVQLLAVIIQCNGGKLEEAEDFKCVFFVYCVLESGFISSSACTVE